MPLDVYWEVKDLLQSANFLVSHGDDAVQVQDLYRKIFKRLSPYAAFEKDRIWLLRNSST